jgi:3-oxoacid CoA-transferase subunit B
MIITDIAVFSRPDRRSPFTLRELAPGIDADLVRQRTEAHYLPLAAT